MQFHFFMISAQFPEEGQQALNAFCAQHRVLTAEKHFVDLGAASYWSICVSMVEGDPHNPLRTSPPKRAAVDYREILSEQEFSLYAQLRELRKTLAKQDDIPVYAIFSNEQLAEMVTRPVRTQSELAQIEGIGKARLEKYGQTFLKLLQSSLAEQSTVNDQSVTDETSAD